MSRLKRFLHLEAPRTERPGEGPRSTEGRFSRMEPERAPGTRPPTPPPSAAAERMQRQVSEQPLTLDRRDRGEELFTRCMRCEADNSRFAQDCAQCGSSLQTAEQRAYNDAFWERRHAEVAEEARAFKQFQENRAQAADAQRHENAALQARAFEMMKAEAHLGGPGGYSDTPLGVRLLASIQSATLQRVVGGAFALVGLLCGLGVWRWLGTRGGMPLYLCFGGLAVLVFLFTPPSWWRARYRNRWWWDGPF